MEEAMMIVWEALALNLLVAAVMVGVTYLILRRIYRNEEKRSKERS